MYTYSDMLLFFLFFSETPPLSPPSLVRCTSRRPQGPNTGTNTDSVTFDMDRPTYEDERAIDDYYSFNYNPNTDDKPFSSGLLE